MSALVVRGDARRLPLPDERLTPERLESILRRLVPAPSGCLEWTGACDPRGYGRVGYGPRKYGTGLVHRIVYEAFRGPVPDGLELDHTCRNPRCAYPDHLEPVTHAENVRRGDAPAQLRERNDAITHCPRGHEYDEANTYRRSNRPARECRTCRNEASKQYRRRAKG